MAFNSTKVEQLLHQKRCKVKDFFTYVYPNRKKKSNSSSTNIIDNSNPKADTIERIADFLGCSIDYLFDRESQYTINNRENQIIGDNNSVGNVQINSDPEVLMATNNHLRDIISRQDKTIAEQNRRIDQLIELAKH